MHTKGASRARARVFEKAARTPLRPLVGREDSQAAVLPQAFEDRVHERQLDGVVQESGAKDESSRFGTGSPSI